MRIVVHVGSNLAINGASRAAFYWAYALKRRGIDARLGYCGEWMDRKGFKRGCGLLVDTEFIDRNMPFKASGLLMPTEYVACRDGRYEPDVAGILADAVWDFDEGVATCSTVNPFRNGDREIAWIQYVHYPGYPIPRDTKIHLFTANSTWTLEHIYKAWGRVNAIVAQPAVPVMDIEPCDVPPSRRDYDIVVWDRFDSSKLMGADVVLPRLAGRGYRIVILGSADKSLMPFLLTSGAERVVTNATWREIHRVICSSRVLMSFKVDEHFGLATAEAVAIGIIPLVHMSGGKWTDTCANGKYCFGFTNMIDAYETAVKLVDDARSGRLDDTYYRLRDGARTNLTMMQDAAFLNLMSKLTSIIEGTAAQPQRG